jgi:hypothetical protein
MRIVSWLWIIIVCFVCGGATCARRSAPLSLAPPPIVWTEVPTLAEITTIVNRTANIRQLSSNSASVDMLSTPGVPKLNATLSLEREQRFRLRASVPVMVVAGVDLGSNEEVFWLEVPEGMSKTLYFARHDQYRQQLHRAILPVDPTWVMDALGLVQIDPAAVVAGPVRRDDGKLEIRSLVTMPDGAYNRVLFIDPQLGHVTDQFLEDPNGRLIAHCHASKHVYQEQVQCSLPQLVELHLLPAIGPPLSMRIEIGSYAINQLLSGDPNLFTMPTSASNAVDLTTISGNGSILSSATPAASHPSHYSADVSAAYPLRGSY